MTLRRGDTVQVNFDPAVGRGIGKTRPAVVIQNDIGNQVSPTVVVAAITDHSPKKATYPFCIEILRGIGGLKKRSLINCAHIRTIDRARIVKRIGQLPDNLVQEMDLALKISLGLR